MQKLTNKLYIIYISLIYSIQENHINLFAMPGQSARRLNTNSDTDDYMEW